MAVAANPVAQFSYWPDEPSAVDTTELAQRPGFGHGQQVKPCVQGTRLDLGLCRGQGPRRPFCRIGRQHRRPLEERGRGGEPTSCLRPASRTLQLSGDVFIGTSGSLGAVPCTPVGIAHRICHLCQCPVCLLLCMS
jgi:hypothetical protein